MSFDLDKARALLASVEGFTPGPWVHDEGVDPHFDRFFARAASVDTAPDERGGADHIALVHGYEGPNGRLLAAAPDLHRELTEAVGEIEIRDRQQAGTQAMLDGIWRTLDAAGVRDDVDERYMQQVSEHCYEPAGEYRQADPEERVGFLAAEVVRLRAHNARMVAQINALADACEAAMSSEDGSLVVCDALPGRRWSECSTALRRLAAGEVDDG